VRDHQGQPIIPDRARLPSSFPAAESPASKEVQAAIQQATAASPVLAELDFIAEQVRIDLQTAENMLLPKLDARLLAAKDIGGPASPKRDKAPFQLEVGLFGEVPLQRRAALGKIAAAEAKLAQINAKRQFVVNKITAAVQDAVSALKASAERIERADTNLELATETLRLGRLQFDAGDIDLVTLNIYEKSVSDAQLLQIAAYADFFIAVADYRAALAIDPLQTVP
jgi:outer membrane protein TolC